MAGIEGGAYVEEIDNRPEWLRAVQAAQALSGSPIIGEKVPDRLTAVALGNGSPEATANAPVNDTLTATTEAVKAAATTADQVAS